MTEDDSLQYAKENKKEIISSVIDGKEKEEEKTAIFYGWISFVYYFQVMLGIIQMNFNEDHHSW